MGRKLTIEFIRERFESEGYILLTVVYTGAFQKLEYICPNGHRHSMSWANWQQGKRCAFCAGQGKPTIEFIGSEFKEEGYLLLSRNYVNERTKLDFICPNGHYHSITWNDWRTGCRCLYCSRPVITMEHVIGSFEKEGCNLLTTVYINNKTKLEYICFEGHYHKITWNDWVRGYRCPICAIVKMSGPNHPNWKGGISFEPYCPIWKDKKFKEFIKQRDGYRCMNPYCSSNDPNDLVGHHIDYNKKNCDISNIITVCRSCNARANVAREWHTAWYQAIMYMRYNYKYLEMGV